MYVSPSSQLWLAAGCSGATRPAWLYLWLWAVLYTRENVKQHSTSSLNSILFLLYKTEDCISLDECSGSGAGVSGNSTLRGLQSAWQHCQPDSICDSKPDSRVQNTVSADSAWPPSLAQQQILGLVRTQHSMQQDIATLTFVSSKIKQNHNVCIKYNIEHQSPLWLSEPECFTNGIKMLDILATVVTVDCGITNLSFSSMTI